MGFLYVSSRTADSVQRVGKCKNQSEKCKTTTQNVRCFSSHTIACGIRKVTGNWLLVADF
jgi:hypothetical protein